MKYNKEQILKSLEACRMGKRDCNKCCYIFICDQLYADAIELINELSKENERLRAERDVLDITVKDLRGRNKGLQRANESLAKDIAQLEAELCECVQIKANTVRKMQEEWNELKFMLEGEYYVFAEDLDQIAKEMLDDEI